MFLATRAQTTSAQSLKVSWWRFYATRPQVREKSLASWGKAIAHFQAFGQAGLFQLSDVDFEHGPVQAHFFSQNR